MSSSTEKNEPKILTGKEIIDATTILERIADDIKQYIIGQDKFIDLVIVTFLAQEGILVKGPPGVAKTSVARLFAKKTGLRFFKYQLQRDTRLAELVGTQSYKALKEDKVTYVLDKLAKAEVGVIDELPKGPSKIIAALRQIFQERSFQEEPVPLICYIATMNPSDEETIDPADIDRFALSITIQGLVERAGSLPSEDNEEFIDNLLKLDTFVDPMKEIVPENPEIVRNLLDLVPRIPIPDFVNQCLKWMIIEIQGQATVTLSDRVLLKAQKILKAHALYSGKPRVGLNDLKAVAAYIFGHRIEDGIDPNLLDSIITNTIAIADFEQEDNIVEMSLKKQEIERTFQNLGSEYLRTKYSNIVSAKRKARNKEDEQVTTPLPVDTTDTDIAWNQVKQDITKWRKAGGANKASLKNKISKELELVFKIPNEKLTNIPEEFRQILMMVRNNQSIKFPSGKFAGWTVTGDSIKINGKGGVVATFTLKFTQIGLDQLEKRFRAVHSVLTRVSEADTEVTLA